MAPTVLIADADTLCDQYRRFFSYQGWHVQTSGDGLECLAELRRCAGSQFDPRVVETFCARFGAAASPALSAPVASERAA